MHILFANTGVQIVCIPLKGGSRYQTAQIGYGWQRCQCGSGAESETPRAIPSSSGRSSSRAPPSCSWRSTRPAAIRRVGYFCSPDALTKDHVVRLEGLLDVKGQPLKGVPPIELCIRPATATAGDAKHVHMVIDFGNSRTGALLAGIGRRDQPDAADAAVRADATATISTPGTRRASSSACPPHAGSPRRPIGATRRIWPPLSQHQDRVPRGCRETTLGRGGSGAARSPGRTRSRCRSTPPLFDDLSMVRMGREADDVVQVMRAEGDIRTGLSSPKRYLWADDASWLEGANWHMADPADRCQTGTYASTLSGPFLHFVHEDDRDFLLEDREPKESEYASDTPLKPRHAPRCMMTAALYELLCQAYTYVNSTGLSQRLGRRRPHPRNPHAHAHLSQRHDPGGAEAALPPRPRRPSTSSP